MKYCFSILLLAMFGLASCDSNQRSPQKNSNVVISSPLIVEFQGDVSRLIKGQSLQVAMRSSDSSMAYSDISLYLDDELITTSSKLPFEFEIKTDSLLYGNHIVRLTASDGQKVHGKGNAFVLHSSLVPQQYNYVVKNIFDHDPEAYTQGLLFLNGFLYEGTGHKSLSSLRKVDLEKGEVLQKVMLDDKIFGEGLAFLNNQFYQLSWTSQVGFVYDINLNELGRFYYSGEGWGLTTDSVYLIRSDGSNKLFFHQPNDFKLHHEIEVYSNEGPVNKLNELEYIHGKIYANVWQSNHIYIIDPKTGAVEGLVNLKNLLSKNFRTSKTEVLNGIAFDPEKNRFFVTGKYWPKLFEIELQEKPI